MKYQDIQISDVALQKEFITNWMNGAYQSALDLLKTNPQLDTKSFMAKIFNKIGNALNAIEQIYHTDFINALEMQLDKYDKAIADFIYKKDWQNNRDYFIGNSVLYNNEIYFCIQNNTNVVPTNITYWAKLGLQGEQGKFGINAKMKYDWDIAQNYIANDVVVYNKWLWFALQNNKGQKPMDNSIYWVNFLEIPSTKIYTSVEPPTVVYDGLIWNQILN